ncbi:malectin domain-containing carbohydrate-binding protein [Rubripirellula obstinata]|nr:malectin domain-containing carbohydrate-binding protein [Rubripirellula obstinata]
MLRRRRVLVEKLEPRHLMAATVFRVNAGGGLVDDVSDWTADSKSLPSAYVNADATGNRISSTIQSIDLSDPSIPSGTPQAIFQKGRWDPGDAPEMEWEFPVSAGDYEVRLFFAEIFSGNQAVGERVFDVSIENQLVLNDYDVFADVGADKGVMKSFTVTSDSVLDIDFGRVTENPMISAIEILQLTSGGGNSAPVLSAISDITVAPGSQVSVPVSAQDADGGDILTLSESGFPSFVTLQDNGNGSGLITIAPPVGSSGTYSGQVTATDNGSPALSDSEAFSINVSGGTFSSSSLYRVNAGGPSVADGLGWDSDSKSLPSTYSNAVATGNRISSTIQSIDLSDPSIPSGTPQAIFQKGRWDPGDAPELEWEFPVSAGDYEVRLFFAEIFSGNQAVGERVFDVSIENQLVLIDYDVFADVGADKGVMKSFTVTSDSVLDIDFGRVTENPMISAIEILQLTSGGGNSAPVLSAISDITVAPGSQVSVPVSAQDADGGDVLTLSESGFPSFVTLQDNGNGSGLITIAPPVGSSGTYSGQVTATDNGSPALSDSEAFSINVSGGTSSSSSLYRVNAGGPSVADGLGWDSDSKSLPSTYSNAVATGNRISSTIQSIDLSDPSIPSGTPQAIFQKGRWDPGDAPELEWEFPVSAGDYEVRLFFAEIFSGNQAVGERVFNVSIENQLVLIDYDVFADVGADKGVMKSFTVTSDSVLDIDFGRVTENPMISAIEILQLTSGGGNSAPVLSAISDITVAPGSQVSVPVSAQDADGGDILTLSESGFPSFVTLQDNGNGSGLITIAPPVGSSGTYSGQVTATDNGSPALSDSEAFTINVGGVNSGDGPLYRVNAGGPNLASTPDWTTDTKVTWSPYLNAAAIGNTLASTTQPIDLSDPSIPSGTPQALFQTERWDQGADPDMKWEFPVTSGPYEVRLFFAETFTGTQSIGARIFDVSIEGQTVLDDYDVYADVGGYTGVMKSFIVSSDSVLNIDFGHVKQSPAVKGIEVISLPSPPNTLLVSPTELAFGNVTSGSSQTASVTLTNGGASGDPSITISSINTSGAAVFSTMQSGSLPIVLAPGQALNVPVQYSPTGDQTSIGTLTIQHSGTGGPISIPLSGTSGNSPINFSKSTLNNAGVNNPTTLQFGPDGRLYVGQQDGTIKALTIQRNGPTDYSVTAVETINQIKNIPNHNDDGSPNPNENTRLLTGLLVVGTASQPVIYAGSSDPRIGAGPSGTDLNLDTNSGVISRLTKTGSSWSKLDLVRGLPRSEENHSLNGLVLDESSNTLFVTAGGNTNMGAPSNNFALLPEYALSAAILSVDLDAIGESTYDLPTLNDQDRPGTNDLNDPFGGNNGKNQAKLVPGGPVQVHSPGWRNPYDIVLTESGKLYSIDNGSNSGWGDIPIINNNGTPGNSSDDYATNQVNEPGKTMLDGLHLIDSQGYYAGHPNPTRASTNNKFNPSNPQSPVSIGNPQESFFEPSVANSGYPGKNGSFVQFNNSTNGLTEYTASNFGGQLKGDLLAVSYGNDVKRIQLNGAGNDDLSTTNLFSSVGAIPLDITTQGDSDVFAGSIWIADYVNNSIVIFEPSDGGNSVCPGDQDCDMYSDSDELANETDPANAADFPADNDGDFTSDLLDDDDDNDSVLDIDDAFAIDAFNGSQTPIGTIYTWENGTNSGGLLNLNFTGLMKNGSDDYLDQFDAGAVTAGGAAGVLTIDAAGSGTALGASNDQEQALQFGFNAGSTSEAFVGKTSVVGPFSGLSPEPNTEMGFYLGTGDQDNYVSLVVTGANGGQVKFLKEVGGNASVIGTANLPVANVDFVELDLRVDPDTNVVQAIYQASVGGNLGQRVTLPQTTQIPASWINANMAIGVISTDSTPNSEVPVTWDFLGVEAAPPTSNVPGSASLIVNQNGSINASTYNTNSIKLTNASESDGPLITEVTFDLSTTFLPDVVFDPQGTAGDIVSRGLIPSSGVPETGFVVPNKPNSDPFSVPHQDGFYQMSMVFTDFGPGETIEFGVDIDPTTIKGLPSDGQGSDWAGSISGLEISGATMTVTFSDGSTMTSTVFATGNTDGESSSIAAVDAPAAPGIELLGVASTPTTINSSSQTIRVTGQPGQQVRLMVAEGQLDPTTAVFDVDPFEANSVIAVDHFNATIGASGNVDVPLTLAQSDSNGGIFHFLAVVQEADGRTSDVSPVLVVQLDEPSVDPDNNPAFIEVDGVVVMEVESRAATDDWESEASITDFTGSGYYRWDGPNLYDQDQAGSLGVLEYRVLITNPGTYQLRVRSHRDDGTGTDSNDVWVKMDSGNWKKIYSSVQGQWTWNTKFDQTGTNPDASYTLEPGMHTFSIGGRSKDFRIDRVVLVNTELTTENAAKKTNVPESDREGGNSGPATFASFDVNDDLNVTALDALMVMNSISSPGAGEGEKVFSTKSDSNLTTDVNGDGRTTALDALQVINYLSRINRGSQALETEQSATLPQADDEDQTLIANEFADAAISSLF